ncbi:DUF2541 family protein [Aeromonas cavernicola]|uniref:DUF2541 domain-containing protein n=1 Tax=Aeromonas cavernicola TaxID=1006623 RepID=A0A2H9U4L0_9GAMM|nr:DUF2541 family protein [Aeromonas cavernicola]PJG58956.1 DUF2541 domain-containing protein [Aeromonas cavernicola]
MSLMSIWNSHLTTRILVGGLLLVSTSAVQASDDQFTLGRTILLGAGDHGATIPLVVCRQTKYIKVKAERDLTLERVVVTYGGDRTKTIYFDRDMRGSKETEWKSLGSRRCVKKIEIFGNSDRSKAGVKVFGRK